MMWWNNFTDSLSYIICDLNVWLMNDLRYRLIVFSHFVYYFNAWWVTVGFTCGTKRKQDFYPTFCWQCKIVTRKQLKHRRRLDGWRVLDDFNSRITSQLERDKIVDKRILHNYREYIEHVKRCVLLHSMGLHVSWLNDWAKKIHMHWVDQYFY